MRLDTTYMRFSPCTGLDLALTDALNVLNARPNWYKGAIRVAEVFEAASPFDVPPTFHLRSFVIQTILGLIAIYSLNSPRTAQEVTRYFGHL